MDQPVNHDGKRMRRMLGAGLLLTALLVLGMTLSGTVVGDDTRAQPPTITATLGSVEKVVTAQGRLQPRSYVDVGAQVSGQLKSLHVDVGDRVKKGDLLAEIDASVQQARLAAQLAQRDAQQARLVEAESRLGLARVQYQRQLNLHAANATSEEELQIAEASLRSAEASVQVLTAQIRETESNIRESEASLSYTRIYAPMDGMVVSLSAREGQTLNANQTAPVLLRIANLSTMTVEAEVSEADVMRLRAGMPVYFSPLGAPDQKWHARLRQILPTPRVQNNVVLYTALFDVDNEDGRLMNNMTAQVFFVEGRARDVVTVPRSSLVGDGEVARVQVLSNGQPEWRTVKVGLSDRLRAEIREGLAAGEPVVVEHLAMGDGAGGGRRGRTGGLL